MIVLIISAVRAGYMDEKILAKIGRMFKKNFPVFVTVGWGSGKSYEGIFGLSFRVEKSFTMI